MKWNPEETIAAIATPPGVGGIAIVRLSGPQAVAIASRLFSPSGPAGLAQAASHQMVHGWVVRQGVALDEALAVAMRAPRSYTGEEVVEIQCHGGNLAAGSVLALALAQGARLAQPGEFTWRAFMNGRLDLTQVEAVAGIIHANSDLGLKVAASQLKGALHQEIEALKERVAQAAALVTADIDFPEEELLFSRRAEIEGALKETAERLERLLAHAHQGRVATEGLKAAIVGRPNVGKSSLLNRLVKEARAIVTDIPGTTRDTLEEVVQIKGVGVRLIDTAGLRHTEELVEAEGIKRARAAMERAELTLLVVDATHPPDESEQEYLAAARPNATLLVVNKADQMEGDRPGWWPGPLPQPLLAAPTLAVSAKTGQGMEALEQAIHDFAVADEGPLLEHPVLATLRQQEAAQNGLEAVQNALESIRAGLGEELIAVDLQRALEALGAVVGDTTVDDLLERIFERFCIGK